MRRKRRGRVDYSCNLAQIILPVYMKTAVMMWPHITVCNKLNLQNHITKLMNGGVTQCYMYMTLT